MRRLYLACDTLFEKLMMTALFTCGMRRAGFCCALREPTYRGQVWRTVEKGNRPMSYPVSPALRALIGEWVSCGNCGPSSPYLFPRKTSSGHVSPRCVNEAFRRVAERAGVSGPHAHPHTTRHTVAWTLAAIGNKVEDIAALLGHRDLRTTNEVYIALSHEERMSRMVCPWSRLSDEDEEEDSLMVSGVELASAIASPFLSEDQRTFPTYEPPAPTFGGLF